MSAHLGYEDVSAIEDKVLSMYAKGLSQRDIAETIEEIYGFNISHEVNSQIADKVLKELEQWQTRPLKKLYSSCLWISYM